jgi:hypothetical protein
MKLLHPTIYTAWINNGDANNKHFCGDQDWQVSSLAHNRKYLGEMEVVTGKSIYYKKMKEVATKVYGRGIHRCWSFGTLSLYIIWLEYLNNPKASSELIWIEMDMVINPKVPLPFKYGICMTYPWDGKHYTANAGEAYKMNFCDLLLPDPVRPYKCLMSSWHRLKWDTVHLMVEGLHKAGLDLLTVDGWGRIYDVEQQMGLTGLYFVADMLLEVSWMALPWSAGDVFDCLGWVLYDPKFEDKPILHFTENTKPQIVDWCKAF